MEQLKGSHINTHSRAHLCSQWAPCWWKLARGFAKSRTQADPRGWTSRKPQCLSSMYLLACLGGGLQGDCSFCPHVSMTWTKVQRRADRQREHGNFDPQRLGEFIFSEKLDLVYLTTRLYSSCTTRVANLLMSPREPSLLTIWHPNGGRSGRGGCGEWWCWYSLRAFMYVWRLTLYMLIRYLNRKILEGTDLRVVALIVKQAVLGSFLYAALSVFTHTQIHTDTHSQTWIHTFCWTWSFKIRHVCDCCGESEVRLCCGGLGGSDGVTHVQLISGLDGCWPLAFIWQLLLCCCTSHFTASPQLHTTYIREFYF